MADDEPMEATSSSSSDSDDSNGPDTDVSPEDATLIMQAESALEANPYDYDGHARYIALLRKCGLTVNLKEARTAMQSIFPLGESIWLEWLGDEEVAAAGSSTAEEVLHLYDLAVQDYLSVELWLAYLRFAVQQAGSGAGESARRVTDLFERALAAAGLHFSQGGRVWEAYRRYLISQGDPQVKVVSGGDRGAKNPVAALFRRQLAVPLADGPDAWAAWEAYSREHGMPTQELEVPYKKARQAAELRAPYEEALARAGATPDAQLLGAYMSYIAFEEKDGSPASCQCVYERAISVFPVTHFLWLQYCRYLEAHLKIGALSQRAYARATRNCPWVGQLWERRIRALLVGGLVEESAAVYKLALAANLPTREEVVGVVLARAQAFGPADGLAPLRRHFKEAEEHLEARFPGQLDYNMALPAFWAELEARRAEAPAGLAPARDIWERVLRSPVSRRRKAWVAAIAFELRHGGIDQARTMYKRCHSRRLEDGGQARLCMDWMAFEGLYGSAASHLQASIKVEPILAASAAAAAAAQEAAAAAEAEAAVKRKPLDPEEMRARRQAADPNFKPRASKPGAGPGKVKKPRPGPDEGMAPPAPKRPRALAQAGVDAVAELAEEGTPSPAPTPAIQNGNDGGSSQAPTINAGPSRGPAVPGSSASSAGQFVAFVKHLAPSVGNKELSEFFKDCGPITDIRIGMNTVTQKPKGFAYVEFASAAGLRAACRLDRELFHGKHVFVAPSDRPKPQPHAEEKAQGGGAARGSGAQGGRGGGAGAGGGRDEPPVAPTPNTTMKPRSAFMPRAALLKAHAPEGPPKSNADFRSMLLQPKQD